MFKHVYFEANFSGNVPLCLVCKSARFSHFDTAVAYLERELKNSPFMLSSPSIIYEFKKDIPDIYCHQIVYLNKDGFAEFLNLTVEKVKKF